MWAAAVRGSVTPEHVQKMRDVVRRHFAAALPLPIDRLTTARMDAIQSDYLAGRRTGQGWKRSRARVPGSWNTVRRYINALVNWCVERGLLAARPFKTRAIKVQKKVLPTLWPEDAGRFLEAVRSLSPSLDVQTAVLLMLSLGLRENEALGATWEGFDGRQGVYCPPRTKNREAREIALPPGLLKRVRGAHGDGREGLVLKGPKGAHRGGYTAKTVAQAGLALGIKGLHPHSLRATFATAHWEAGTPLGQIMAMLGHAQPQTTMLYIRQRPRDAAAAQAKVAKAMGGFLAG
jgi:integrase